MCCMLLLCNAKHMAVKRELSGGEGKGECRCTTLRDKRWFSSICREIKLLCQRHCRQLLQMLGQEQQVALPRAAEWTDRWRLPAPALEGTALNIAIWSRIQLVLGISEGQVLTALGGGEEKSHTNYAIATRAPTDSLAALPSQGCCPQRSVNPQQPRDGSRNMKTLKWMNTLSYNYNEKIFCKDEAIAKHNPMSMTFLREAGSRKTFFPSNTIIYFWYITLIADGVTCVVLLENWYNTVFSHFFSFFFFFFCRIRADPARCCVSPGKRWTALIHLSPHQNVS